MGFLDFLFGKSEPPHPPTHTYITKAGGDCYKFSFHPRTDPNDDGWEIDIHQQPGYRGQKQAQTIAHWIPSPRYSDMRMICFTYGKYPETKEIAKDFAAQWAEMTSTYIRTGATLDAQIAQLN